MTSRVPRRLPGIRFEVPPPQLDEVLPRMDIAVFVGFARSGPVDVPVAVESAVDFEAIFGAGAPLAWDPSRGEMVQAQLAPAVRSFFRNGGVRCWVIRVADRPATNYFPIPGLLRWSGTEVTPAFARATSPGSWSDVVAVAAAEQAEPLAAVAFAAGADRGWVDVSEPDQPRAGDLLRIQTDSGHIVMLAVADVEHVELSPPAPGIARAMGRVIWFRPPGSLSPPASAATARLFSAARDASSVTESFALEIPLLDLDENVPGAPLGTVRLEVQLRLDDMPTPGALVSVEAGDEQLWLSVADTGVVSLSDAGQAHVRVLGSGFWRTRAPQALAATGVARCDRLDLDLWVRRDEARHVRLSGLGLVPGHPRYWACLPDDVTRHEPGPVADPVRAGFITDARGFPVAGAGDPTDIYLPLTLRVTPVEYLGAVRPPRSALERDGLAAFGPSLFVDRDLVTPLTERLLNAAEHLRYRKAGGRHLRGLHAALEIEEATIIAVPDAAQRGWFRVPATEPARPQTAAPVPPPAWGTFLACSTRVIKRPRWVARFRRQTLFRVDTGTYTLEWHRPDADTFVLQEARSPDFSDATAIHSGPASRLTLYGRAPGAYYYRVRAASGTLTSNWSRPIVMAVAGPEAWHLIPERDYVSDTLLVVHRALLRMASARGDLLAVLAMPAHLREDDALSYVGLLKRPRGPAILVGAAGSGALSRSLDEGELRAFSFGALYHPWLVLREGPGDRLLTRVSPDGVAAGLIAARALGRGAWIAPANEPLRGVLAITPSVARDRRAALVDDCINVIRHEPRGFLPLSANTLSDDVNLAPINVRRLLSLLRRLALREGATYVFEPHDAALRRLVQRGFERMLTRMFERGAFAGATAAASFQVNTATSLNTPQSVNAGRFIVELRVAPSLPMTFLTVRLVQSGDRTLVMEER